MSSLLSMTFNFPNNTRLNTKQKQNFTVVFLTAVIFFFFLQYITIFENYSHWSSYYDESTHWCTQEISIFKVSPRPHFHSKAGILV